jgi:Bacteriophage probable baseplate hub protein
MAVAKPDTPLVAHVEILVNGSTLPAETEAHIAGVVVEDDVALPSMFAVELTGSDDQSQPTPWVDDPLFAVGNAVEVKMGYVDDVATVFRGEIVALEPAFALDRLPSLTVRGYDRRHRLVRERKTRTFLQQKDSDIASQVAGDAGLTGQVEDSGVVHDYVLQANQTDMEFLQERARRIHYEVVVDDKTLLFRSVGNAAVEVVTLTMNDDLLEFLPRLSAMRQLSEVTLQAWDAKAKQGIVATATTGDETAVMGGGQSGAALVQSAFASAVGLITDRPVATQAEADQIAKARFNGAVLELVRAEATCLGRTDVEPGDVIKIDGVGTRFGGPYYVTAVVHRYSPERGYHTQFALRRNAV